MVGRWEKVGEGGRRWKRVCMGWEKVGEGMYGVVEGGRRWEKVEEGGRRWEKVGEGGRGWVGDGSWLEKVVEGVLRVGEGKRG